MTATDSAAIRAESERLIARGRQLRAELAQALGYDAQPQQQPARQAGK